MDKTIVVGVVSALGGIIVGSVSTFYIYKHKVDSIVEREITSLKETYRPEKMEKSKKTKEIEVESTEPEEVDISIIRTDYGEPITREKMEQAHLKYHNLIEKTTVDEIVEAEIIEEDPEGYVDPHDFDDVEDDVLTGIVVYSFDEYVETNTNPNYPQVLLVYSNEKDRLITEDDEVVKDHIRIIGKEAKQRLNKKQLDDGDSLYIVNHDRQMVYEVYMEEY